jgi:hypothetical protein
MLIPQDTTMNDQILRKALTKLATEVPELRKHLVPIMKSAYGGKLIVDERSWDSFRVIFPDPSGQTYDSYLIDHRNPKTVARLAQQAMQLWRKANPSSNDHADLETFVDKYVKEKSNGKWDYVRWNSKSYPD